MNSLNIIAAQHHLLMQLPHGVEITNGKKLSRHHSHTACQKKSS
ncbi:MULTISPECIES: hypothetical protein [unclassified Herbaspirillum]|nr:MULTISPECIES: hypothetical protein [unclassified Herbaspirillum]